MYDAQDIEALLREHPRFHRGAIAKGPSLTFREATEADATFILSLRLDPDKNRHLSPVADDVAAQKAFIRNDPGLYYIIEAGVPCGTARLYNQRGTSFEWGSWIMRDHPKGSAIEAMCMVYEIGLDFGFRASHFSVRKENRGVWKMHERFGAKRTGETDADYLYSIDKGAILAALKRHAIPVTIAWPAP